MTTSTLNHDAELPITKEDCLEYLGVRAAMQMGDSIAEGMRVGQAFMNTISPEDYYKLTGTLLDPFYRDDWLSVRQALMFLLEN